MDSAAPSQVRVAPQPCCYLPACLEAIIEKKVNRIALSVFEKIADWLCTWLWCGYADYFRQKEAEAALAGVRHPLAGAWLFDQTAERVAGVIENRRTDLFDRSTTSRFDISLCGRALVLISEAGKIAQDVYFGRDHHTDRVVVTDDAELGPGHFVITEYETDSPPNVWHIDAARPYVLQQMTDFSRYFCPEGRQQEEFPNLPRVGSEIPVFISAECIDPSSQFYVRPQENWVMADPEEFPDILGLSSSY